MKDAFKVSHGFAFLAVSFFFILFFLSVFPSSSPVESDASDVSAFFNSDLDPDDALHAALWSDLIARSAGDSASAHFLAELESVRKRDQTFALLNRHRTSLWTVAHVSETVRMLLQFFALYLLTLGLLHYCVESVALARFLREKRRDIHSVSNRLQKGSILNRTLLLRTVKAAGRWAGYTFLFSPAYVAVYAFKGLFDVSSVPVYVVLGVCTNGILIVYAEKYYYLLKEQSRSGWMEFATVKGLGGFDDFNGRTLWKSVLSVKKSFPGHVLSHLLANVRHLYVPTFKEQAGVLVTGLVVVEMALNIQGFIGYELLRQISYKNFDYVVLILYGLFLVVQSVHVIADLTVARKRMVYENMAH